jgi:antitoxin MazE
MATRRIFRTGNSVVVSLPQDVIEPLGLAPGREVSVALDKRRGEIIICALQSAPAGVDEEFARQVSEFIEEYRPALHELARR